MARLWMKIDSGIAHSPKLRRTAQILGITRPQTLGHLVSLWGWAANFAESGFVGDQENGDLARAAEWKKNAALFVDSLYECGWIESTGYLHDWVEWGGAGVTSRAESRERTRTVREQSANSTGMIRAKSRVDRDKSREELSTTSPAFDEFWETYPRKAGKRTARVSYDRALRRADASTILAGARRYRDDPAREPGFTAHPATWLNRDGWEDDPEPARGSSHPTDRRLSRVLSQMEVQHGA